MIDLFMPCAITDYLNAAWFFDWFVNNASYIFVFIFMMIESSFIPLPVGSGRSARRLPGRAARRYERVYRSARGHSRSLGRSLGQLRARHAHRTSIVYAFANSRFGHACLINEEKVRKAEKYFDKHGANIHIYRPSDSGRASAHLHSGRHRQNEYMDILSVHRARRTCVECYSGAVGWWLAQHVMLDQLYDAVEKYNGYLTIAGLIILSLCVVYIIYNAFKTKKKIIMLSRQRKNDNSTFDSCR